MMRIQGNFYKLKKLCLEARSAYNENSKLLLEFYSKKTGRGYNDFLETELGKKSDSYLKLARAKLQKVIHMDCTEYGGEYDLCELGILAVLRILEGCEIK